MKLLICGASIALMTGCGAKTPNTEDPDTLVWLAKKDFYSYEPFEITIDKAQSAVFANGEKVTSPGETPSDFESSLWGIDRAALDAQDTSVSSMVDIHILVFLEDDAQGKKKIYVKTIMDYTGRPVIENRMPSVAACESGDCPVVVRSACLFNPKIEAQRLESIDLNAETVADLGIDLERYASFSLQRFAEVIGNPESFPDKAIDFSGDSGDIIPRVRVQPLYPIPAARKHLEGWTRSVFTIDRHGKVKDVEVIDQDDSGLFKAPTIEALKQWIYVPKVVMGEIVESHGIVVQLTFELEYL